VKAGALIGIQVLALGGLLLLALSGQKKPSLDVQSAVLLAAAERVSAGRMTNPKSAERVREVVTEGVRDAALRQQLRALAPAKYLEDAEALRATRRDRDTINDAYEALAESGLAIVRNI